MLQGRVSKLVTSIGLRGRAQLRAIDEGWKGDSKYEALARDCAV